MVKPYYCPRCGKGYTQKECIKNDGKLFCYECPSVQLQISGTPLMLIGAFLGLMYLAYYFYNQTNYYVTFIFLPACAGMIFLGLVRNNAAAKAASSYCKKEDDEKQGPIEGCCEEKKADQQVSEEEEEKPDTTEDACCEAAAECEE